MSLTYLGSLTVGDALPAVADFNAQADASLSAQLPDVNARLNGFASIDLTPVTVLDLIAQIQGILTALNALSIPVITPTISVGAQADLTAQGADLSAGLSASVALGNLLSAAGVHAYAYEGQAFDCGPAVSVATSSGLPGGAPSDQVFGLLLFTSVPSTAAALKTLAGI